MSYESVQEMFSRTAGACASRTAIERAGKQVTYAQLEAESNRLANFLLAGGVGRGTMVGLFTDNPIEIITGILGVLKAGAVFVPLDPTFPEQRLQVMSAQVQPGWYVTAAKHVEKLNKLRNEAAQVICVDDATAEYASYERREHPGTVGDGDAPCSIYFTSGSTGKPKAILGRLKGIDHFIRWEIEAVGARVGTRVSQLASPSFDGFLKDAFVPLCAGGVVCAPESRELILDAWSLADWLDVEQVEVLHCVPSVFRALLNEGLNSRYFESMKCVVMTGEPLYPADVKRWMGVFGDRIRLFNIYGTTETSLSKFQYEIKPEDVDRPSIPVGKPIKGSAFMLLDPALQPCPEGVVGEIYIRTPYRSFGYYNEPELTRAVFVQNPFNSDPNDVVHKTGDYGRLLEDGSLEHLGRRDQQVQVRGVRVELGEIENLLRAHDEVEDVAVVDRDDADGNKFLVAYVTMSNGTGTDHLRQYLTERLPGTMLPSAFIELDQLPRTLNGKVDRKALPPLELVRAEREADDLIPRTPIEEIVAGIWSEVLRLPAIGRTDNFFNLGGHSLLVTQVVLRVRDSLKVELPIRSLFELPTVAELSQLIQETINADRLSDVAPIEAVSREQQLPLSFAQQRMWVQEKMAHGSAALHLPLAATLKGELNITALEQALGEIMRRHESLRTSFGTVDGELVQVIAPPSRFKLPVIDLSHLQAADQEVLTKRLREDEHNRPFDLEHGPFVRVALLRHSATEHTIVCTLHHIISDGWSRGLMLEEISKLYEAFRKGEPSSLSDPQIQYADFAVWQRQRLEDGSLDQELAYWKEKLDGAPPVIQLPADHPRPPVQTYRGAVEPVRISPELLEQLKTLSRQQGVTLFMTLLAAFQTLLHRYAGQDDIVVGTTVANRERSEIEGLIGFFVNMLALRVDCSGNPTFKDLLDQVRETMFKAYAYQGVPFEKLVQELQPRRNSSYTPLFQVVFSFQNQPTLASMDLKLSGLELTFPEDELNTSQFDLLLDLYEGREGLAGAFQYNPDLFDRSTIALMVQHFQTLLQSVTSDPEQRLSDVSLLDNDEQTQSLLAWNETKREYPADTCIHHLFETRAQAEPNAIAAVCGEGHLSYAELNRRANQLARYLQKAGVATGERVAICLEHSLDELVGLVGVLKTGAAYVPLDPEHPSQRLSFMLADAGVSIVLTDESLAGKLDASGVRTICLDSDWLSISAESDANVTSSVTAQDVAYVIYTSGSTGQPKGVTVTHQSLVNYAWWAKDVYLKGEALGFALYSSLAFDLTVTSIYVPLITGNKVVIHKWSGTDAPLELILNDDQIGVWKLTPSHLMLIKDWDNRSSSIKRLIVGGEALETDLSRQIHESFGGRVEIFNEYGPTEATVGCMIYRFDPEVDQRPTVPIGRPAANVQLYVLDQWLQPSADNISGELYIAGDGLAQGYLNRADLTAEKFIPNPFASGERMYKTGDRARRLGNGELEYLGRRDDQVKFHGYRVELNEIQLALKKHPEISDSVVVITKDKHDHDVMVAYYVSLQELEVDGLRAFLSDILIAEIIPNVFVHLTKMPLTLNGKINHAVLPSLAEARQRMQRSYDAPMTPQEELLANIWAEVLSLERVGIHENFFALGGHSLLATQIIHRVNQTFHVDLPMRVIFDDPTIAGLALLIEETLIEKVEAASA